MTGDVLGGGVENRASLLMVSSPLIRLVTTGVDDAPLGVEAMFFDLHSGRWWRADLFVCTAYSARVNPGPNNRGDILNTAHCYVAI